MRNVRQRMLQNVSGTSNASFQLHQRLKRKLDQIYPLGIVSTSYPSSAAKKQLNSPQMHFNTLSTDKRISLITLCHGWATSIENNDEIQTLRECLMGLSQKTGVHRGSKLFMSLSYQEKEDVVIFQYFTDQKDDVLNVL